MNNVITEKQSRQITGGRQPHVPVEYENALRSLQTCLTIDDTKYWANKADALSAWAKMYRDDNVGRKAKQLKLHAYKRMGQLAAELRPQRAAPSEFTPKGLHKFKGGTRGPTSLLREHGLTRQQAASARSLADLDEGKFQDLLESRNPPSLTALALDRRNRSQSYLLVTRGPPLHFRTFARANDPKQLAIGIRSDEIVRIRGIVTELIEWLDEFEQHLPKAKP